MWTSFLAVAYKEALQILRDKFALAAAFGVPLIQLTIFGFLDNNVRHIPTVAYDLSRTEESRDLQRRLINTSFFDIVHQAHSEQELRGWIVAGRAKVGINIPPDFAAERLAGRPGHFQVLIDGSDSTVSSQALAAANGVAFAQSVQELLAAAHRTALPLEARPRLLFNPDSRSANFLIPGLVAIILQIVTSFLTALSVVRERERGTLEQLLVTPVHPLGLMLGKLTPYLVLGLLMASGVLTVMRFGFGVPIQGSLVFLMLMAILFLFAALSIGLLISTKAQTQAQAIQMAMLPILPSVLLSGYIFPRASLPTVLWAVGAFLPATHFVEIMRGVVLRNAGLLDLVPNVLGLAAISLVLLVGSTARFKKQVM